jgi:hypothetical protein
MEENERKAIAKLKAELVSAKLETVDFLLMVAGHDEPGRTQDFKIFGYKNFEDCAAKSIKRLRANVERMIQQHERSFPG